MKNKNKLTRFFATLRMTSKRAAFTLTEVAEVRQYAPSPLEGEGWGEGFRKRAAFTLAEVLITLGIIGIVAAMTIPVITKKIDTYKNIARFKVMYSKLINAFNLALVDFGYMPNCGYWEANPYSSLGSIRATYNDDGTVKKYEFIYNDGTIGPLPSDYNGRSADCSELTNKVKTHLKVIKTCSGQSVKNGCLPEDYPGTDTVYQEGHSDATDVEIMKATQDSGLRASSIRNNFTTWVLADGSIVSFNTSLVWFLIDTTGYNGPNKWGYDIFGLKISILKNDNSTIRITAGNSSKQKGGLSSASMIKKVQNNSKY